jgi:hypothetical protein
MTELERARAHLRQAQAVLAFARNHCVKSWSVNSSLETNVLAALSWLWDAQERARA